MRKIKETCKECKNTNSSKCLLIERIKDKIHKFPQWCKEVYKTIKAPFICFTISVILIPIVALILQAQYGKIALIVDNAFTYVWVSLAAYFFCAIFCMQQYYKRKTDVKKLDYPKCPDEEKQRVKYRIEGFINITNKFISVFMVLTPISSLSFISEFLTSNITKEQDALSFSGDALLSYIAVVSGSILVVLIFFYCGLEKALYELKADNLFRPKR